MPRSIQNRLEAAILAGERPAPGRGRKSRVLEIQAGRGKIRLAHSGNKLTAAGRYYEQRTGQQANSWKPGIVLEGRREYAYTANDTKVLVRYRDNSGALRVTKDGRTYFETHATQFLVEVPYVKWHKDTFKNKPPAWRRTSGKGYMSVTEPTIRALADHFAVDIPSPPDIEAAMLEIDDDETELRRQVKEVFLAFPQRLPEAKDLDRSFKTDNCKVLNSDSPGNVFDIYDPGRELRISESITHLQRGDKVKVRSYLDRPLRGAICIPTALERMDLVAGALQESSGNCVIEGVRQAYEKSARERVYLETGSDDEGSDKEGATHVTRKRRWVSDELWMPAL